MMPLEIGSAHTEEGARKSDDVVDNHSFACGSPDQNDHDRVCNLVLGHAMDHRDHEG